MVGSEALPSPNIASPDRHGAGMTPAHGNVMAPPRRRGTKSAQGADPCRLGHRWPCCYLNRSASAVSLATYADQSKPSGTLVFSGCQPVAPSCCSRMMSA